MNSRCFFLYLFLFSLLFTSCFEDNDDNGALASEINDFVWKGMNASYLYKQEISDLDNNRFNDSEEYASYLNSYNSPENLFESLIYERDNIDKFSLIVDNYIELEQYLSGVSLSNGLNFGLVYLPNSTNEIFGYVRYVNNGSEADLANINRGDIFRSIDDIPLSIDNYSDLLSQEVYTVNFANYFNNNTEDVSDDTIVLNDINIELQKVPLIKNPVHHYSTLNYSGGKIGYLMYNQFVSNYDDYLKTIFSEFKSNSVDELILDLRYNPGGSINSAIVLASLITGQFENEIFNTEQWNNDIQNYWLNNNPEYLINRFMSFQSSLNLSRVFILTTRSSASASELIINCLKPYINVIQIGTTTYGKYQASVTLYDSENFSNQNVNRSHNYALQPLVLKTLNANGVTDYYNGISPDYEYEERAFDMGQVGNINEPMLNFTFGIIDSRISLDIKPELFAYIDDNCKFDFLEREMYIDNKEIVKNYEK
jgi:carboxyl-terminal processing protease